VLAAWLVLLAAGAALSALFLGSALTTDDNVSVRVESERAVDLVYARGGELPGTRATVVLVGRGAPATAGRVAGIVRARLPRDQRGTLRVAARPGADTAVVSFEDVDDLRYFLLERAIRAEAARRHAEALFYGYREIDDDFDSSAQRDLRTGELVGIPAALLVLVVVFGSFVAALVPLALALVSLVIGLGIVALIGQISPLSVFVVNMVFGIGLALGIDYALFVVSRYRDERRAGAAPAEAIEVAGATAGRSVLFSGLAVGLCLLAMLLVPETIMRSLGIGAVVVAGVAVLAALTLLPALLSLMGDRIEAGRIPLLARATRHEGAVWARVVAAAIRRPVLSLAVSIAVLLALASPVASLETGRAGVAILPSSTESKRAYEILRGSFDLGAQSPVLVAVDVRGAPELARRAPALVARIAADPAFGRPHVGRGARDLVVVSAPLADEPQSSRSREAVARLRSETIPALFGAQRSRVLVGGSTAFTLDFVKATEEARPAVFATVFALTFLLLLLAFRSLVVALKAVVINILSVAAAYGLLVLVFEKGVGAGLLGLQRVETVESWVPIFMFCVLFALSMDYHVFLLSRVRERYVATGDNARSVLDGVAATASLITGAALIIVVVFLGFALGELAMFQQMGLGVGVALLLDATLVRSVLVPSAMVLLGRRNWYLPRALRWLPEID